MRVPLIEPSNKCRFFLHNPPLLLTLLYLPRAVSDCLPLIYEMNLSLIDHFLLGMDDEEV